jgi:hypothetical protein
VSSILLNNCLLFVLKHHGSFHLSLKFIANTEIGG